MDGEHETRRGHFRVIDRAGLDAIRPPEWLLPDAFPEGAYALLVGAPGTYKTFLALDAALTVATGGAQPWEVSEWIGAWDVPDRPGPVLFAAGEGRASIGQRDKAWERLHLGSKRADGFYLADPVPRITESPASSLRPPGDG